MRLEEFFLNEIKDNSEYSFEKSENTYKIRKFNREIIVESGANKKNSLKDNEIKSLLLSISRDFNELLGDKKFIKNSLYIFGGGEYEHNTQDNIFEFSSFGRENLDKSLIKTGNIVGFISKKTGNQVFKLTISSRFGNNFLKYLICYSDGFLKIPKNGNTSENGLIEWLLIFLWKTKLKSAFRLGISKEYTKKTESLNTIRGNLTNRAIIENIALVPNYECSFKEHSYDNSINRLIANTFRFINNQEIIADIVNIKNDFHYVTQGKKYKVPDLLNYKPVKNSFYSSYNEVAELSKLIIKKQMQDLGYDNSDTSAFLFDVSMLFEHFIRKILKNKGFRLEEKNAKGLNIYHGGSYNKGERNIFPDVIIKNDDGSIDCFDVKYKRFDETFGIKREDLFQIYTYASVLMNEYDVKRFGIIYPSKEKDRKTIINTIKVGGRDINLEIHFFYVPKDDSLTYDQDFIESINSFSLIKK